jgi:RNA polymerase sigma-70 factor (ECF subfamily)
LRDDQELNDRNNEMLTGSQISFPLLSQTARLGRYSGVNAASEAVPELAAEETPFDLEALFCAQFVRIARSVARVVHNPARAEELAVEAFVKLLRHPRVHNAEGNVVAWLYRTAIRLGLDELRQQTRRARLEQWFRFAGSARQASPEDLHAANQEQERVRLVLSAIQPQQAELLLLRGHDLTYNEIAAALKIRPTSLGKLLSRAQQSFRKEYIRRYGEQ